MNHVGRSAGFRDRFWKRHFVGALVGMAALHLAVLIAAGATTAPLIGQVPTDQEPAPRTTQCIPVSGGSGCPGG